MSADDLEGLRHLRRRLNDALRDVASDWVRGQMTESIASIDGLLTSAAPQQLDIHRARARAKTLLALGESARGR